MRTVENKVLFEGWTKFLAMTLQPTDGRVASLFQARISLLCPSYRDQLMGTIAGRVGRFEPMALGPAYPCRRWPNN